MLGKTTAGLKLLVFFDSGMDAQGMCAAVRFGFSLACQHAGNNGGE